MTDLEKRLEAMLTPNADGLLPCERCGETTAFNKYGSFDDYPCWITCQSCNHTQPVKRGWATAVSYWNHRPFVRALVEAVNSLSCDQDMHARNRISECDRCKAERRILAILDGKEAPNV